jgi:pimeloyl-ACP methyl ester carboxylesterase
MDLNADSLRQVLDHLRASGVLGRRFGHHVVVGHSLGSLTAGLMQARYGAADAIVLTGLTGMNVSNINDSPEFNEGFLALLEPVTGQAIDPEIAASCNKDYYVMPAAMRPALFFHQPALDPEILTVDLAIQGTMTAAENATSGLAADLTEHVSGPVLIQIGEFDTFFHDPNTEADALGALATARRLAPANFTFAEPVLGTGHNLTQHPTAHGGFAVIAQWIERLVDSWRTGRVEAWTPGFVPPDALPKNSQQRDHAGRPVFLSDEVSKTQE